MPVNWLTCQLGLRNIDVFLHWKTQKNIWQPITAKKETHDLSVLMLRINCSLFLVDVFTLVVFQYLFLNGTSKYQNMQKPKCKKISTNRCSYVVVIHFLYCYFSCLSILFFLFFNLFDAVNLSPFKAVQSFVSAGFLVSCEPCLYQRGTSDKSTLWFEWNYGLCHLSPQN